MAPLEGGGGLVSLRPGTKAVIWPSRNVCESFIRPGQSFCDGNDAMGSRQNSVETKFRSAGRQARRTRRCAESWQNAVFTSSSWLDLQGPVENRSSRISTKKSVHCKAGGSSPSLTSDDAQKNSGIERGRQSQRFHAASANAPTISTEMWSEEREEQGASNELTRSGNGGHQQSELELDIKVGESDSERYLNFSTSAAILTAKGSRLLHETRAVEKQTENEGSTSFSFSGVDGRLQKAAADAEHLKGKASGSSNGTSIAQDPGQFTSTHRRKEISQGSQYDSGTSDCGTTDAVQTIPPAMGFQQIVKNDLQFLARSFKWAQEVALPSLAERAEKLVTLRLWEGDSVPPAFETPSPRASYPELSGLELLAADTRVIKGYINQTLAWLMAWRLSLESYYEPEMIADYFNRRPHVLFFRILQVSAVFGYVIIRIETEKVFTLSKRPADQSSDAVMHRRIEGAKLIKEALVKLGPCFIKVGQSLSTRPDLVGADMAKIFAELQDSLPPFPTTQAIAIIEEELGRPLNEVFSYLSEEPVAAASFGQVYKGRTVDAQEVAVKVQRPNLLHSVALDIYILRMGLAALREIAKRRSDLKLYADELGQGLFGELDYTNEAANAAEFQEAHSNLTFLRVPNIVTSLSTRRVLTMEWIDGDRPAQLLLVARGISSDGNVYLREEQTKAKRRLFSLVNKGVEASLVQLLDTGVLHADPHPGNLLYTIDGQMVFLDFGLLCRMEKHHQLAMLASVAHIVNADWKNFVGDLAAMEVLGPDIDRKMIAMELEEALGDAIPTEGIPDIKFSKVLVKVLAIALKHHFKMPPYFILVLRSIASLEGLALAVDANFKVFAASYPFVLQRLLTDKSVHSRNVLLSLVLNDKKEFRWDRLASFATLARQHTMKRVALETGMEVQNLTLSNYDTKNISPELIPILVNLLLSKEGVILRRLVLEADTSSLAHALNSSKASVFRRRASTAMANVFYKCGKEFLKEQANVVLQDSVVPPSSLPLEGLSQVRLVSEKSLTDEVKALTNCSDTLDSSVLKSRHLRFLLRTFVSRLGKKPLLLLRTGWSCFTIFCYAIAVAAHRLVVGICCKYYISNSPSTTRSYNKLVPA